MALEGGFTERPPDTITGPFSFKAQARNTGPVGEDYTFEAVLIDPSTGEQATRLWTANTWVGGGETVELTFYLQENRELEIPDGQYDLQVLYGNYPSPDTWLSLANTTVTLDLQSDGGSGGGDDGGAQSPAEDNVRVEIQSKAGGRQYAWLSYRVYNDSDQTVSATVDFNPAGGSGSQEIFQISPGSYQSANVEWRFDNQTEVEKTVCVELNSAGYV